MDCTVADLIEYVPGKKPSEPVKKPALKASKPHRKKIEQMDAGDE